MKDLVNKLVKIKIRGYDYFIGILIDFGEEWILLRNISGDYIIDGFRLINKKYILHINLVINEPLNTITNLKHNNFKLDLNYKLNDTINLITDFKKNKTLLFLSLNNDNLAFVGFIDDIYLKSLSLGELNSKGVLTGFKSNYKYDKIRIIEVGTDYLESLKIYLLHTQVLL